MKHEPSKDSKHTPAAEYSRLELIRDPYLRRAEEAAKVTIPSLFPEEGHSSSEVFKTPFQSLGALGSRNLASRLMLILFPPNAPFFRLRPDEIDMNEAEASGEITRGEIEETMGEIERMVLYLFQTSNLPMVLPHALLLLIVSGNVLLQQMSNGDFRAFKLDRYVVERDPMGNVSSIVTREDVNPAYLPEDIREAIMDKVQGSLPKEVTLFTWARLLDKDQWEIVQEVQNIVLDKDRMRVSRDKLPFFPQRLVAVDGEDYGPSFVEGLLGDLIALERMSQVMYEASAASSKVIWGIKPNSTIKPRDIARVPNGGFIEGDPDDIGAIQLNKFADLGVVERFLERITNSLSLNFLLNSAIRRDAERVTATEIRVMAQELEEALGGVYSVLSRELQLPIIKTLLRQLQKDRRIPKLPDDLVKPQIVTGLEALGRGQDQTKMERWIGSVAQAMGPGILEHLNISEYLKRSAANIGVDIDGLVRSEEEVAAARAQAEQAASQQQLAPNLINQGGQLAKEVIKQQGE